MSIHILNCVTMTPRWPRWRLGGTCLLVETDEGPVLVDTGLGLQYYANPKVKARLQLAITGIPNDPNQCAIRQVTRYRWQPEKVRHIVLTHLHFDHAGGLVDFPQAWVHVYQPEYAAMRKPRTLLNRLAYNRADFAHGPKWVFHDEPDAKWFGFDAIRLEFKPEMYLIPLPGHTRGSCGVVVRDGSGWLFHTGAALPPGARFDLRPEWAIRRFFGSHGPKLKALAEAHPEVRVIAGHMGMDWFGKVEPIP